MKLISNSKELDKFELRDNKEYLLGRSDSNDLTILNKFLSGKHLKLYVNNNQLFIEDLDSKNGTYIEGKKLLANKKYKINKKERIIIGSEDVVFEIDDDLKKEHTQVLKNKDVFTIGRSPDNDIVINSKLVSSKHITIRKKESDWYFYDNNSSNGTYLNSLDNKVSEAKLEYNEKLYLGNYKIPTNEILKFLISSTVQKKNKLSLDKDIITIGRSEESDIHLSHPSVSFNHAILEKVNNNEYYIKDLDSTNGTYVNASQVKKKMIVKDGDDIQIGTHTFKLDLKIDNGASILNHNFLKGMSIEAKNITIEIKDGIKLLDDISFTVNPGELVGLMGLSGAGKTTLLKALNGYDKPTGGSSFIDGNNLYENYDILKTIIGYVPQDDIVHPELTVYEALKYYANLRLPNMKNDELEVSIDNILKKLGLMGTKNTVIGSADTTKGISGGQRKRVNLAMELLAEPKIIFLDEPTSGLSAVDTKMVMEQLRSLADDGITIIITIHQPSLDNYKYMDNQIILSFGKLAYYGPTFPDSINFFNQLKNKEVTLLSNPDNALIGLNKKEEENGELKLDPEKDRNKKGIYWKKEYLKSDICKKFVIEREKEKKDLKTNVKSVSSIKQWLVLTNRYLKIKLKDIGNTSILLIQAPLIAIMIVMLFSKEAYVDMPITLLFVLAISAIWFGTINASREIVSEKAIFERERMIGIQVVPYLLSKFLVLTLLCIIQSVTLVGIVEILPPFSLSMGSDFYELVFLVFLTSLSGLSIGLLVSAFAKSQAQALALVPIVLLPMIIFGGGMLTVKEMNKNDTKIAFYLSQVTPTKWALEEMTKLYENNSNKETYCKNSKSVWTNNINLGKTCSSVYDKNNSSEVAKYSICEQKFENCMQMRSFHEFNYGDKKSDKNTVYIMLGLFIIIPLVLVSLILNRRYKV